MRFTQNEIQSFFDTDLSQLIDASENEVEYISQCHFGDLLIEETNIEGERFKLWKRLECNEGGLLVEYSGKLNNYSYENVLEL